MTNQYNSQDSQQTRRPFVRRRFISRPKICQFCSDKSMTINYKQTDILGRFLMESGKIRPRRQTGTCAKHQRELAREIKRSRHLALLSYIGNQPDY